MPTSISVTIIPCEEGLFGAIFQNEPEYLYGGDGGNVDMDNRLENLLVICGKTKTEADEIISEAYKTKKPVRMVFTLNEEQQRLVREYFPAALPKPAGKPAVVR